jgi:hypothetical protein
MGTEPSTARIVPYRPALLGVSPVVLVVYMYRAKTVNDLARHVTKEPVSGITNGAEADILLIRSWCSTSV